MKEITQYFNKKNTLFSKFEPIEPKALGSRKKIEIYCALDIKNAYHAIFVIEAKSRFLRKNAEDLMLLCQKLIDYKDHNFKVKTALIRSPLCSKAKEMLKDHGWKVKTDY